MLKSTEGTKELHFPSAAVAQVHANVWYTQEHAHTRPTKKQPYPSTKLPLNNHSACFCSNLSPLEKHRDLKSIPKVRSSNEHTDTASAMALCTAPPGYIRACTWKKKGPLDLCCISFSSKSQRSEGYQFLPQLCSSLLFQAPFLLGYACDEVSNFSLNNKVSQILKIL